MATFLTSSPRVPLLLVLCLGITGPVLAKAPDANAQGFAAYNKGDYAKAHALFEKALKQDPSNAYARLNRARTTTLLNQGKEDADDFDYCAFESNWMYLALADLSVAVEKDAQALLPKIDEDSKGLKALKASDEYKKWRKAISVFVNEKGVKEKVLGATSDWWFLQPGQIPESITLAADKRVMATQQDTYAYPTGEWRPLRSGVEITPEKKPARAWKLLAGKYYFDQGKRFFFEVRLEPDGETTPADSGWTTGPLSIGPLSGDCL
ncbi:tetratricopeptide repeat protein [Myxococcus sp. AM011]|uniref:tetratricopeptide repeat protein n=1 Tax=Myxococcus sp. AM011 TaxID=2745200 RepID=UPI0015950020|nr:tetratricopeptide repeat protein [Myxococcus sp. AM011]NVJ23887.1 tetratricopeptide repeat protein [Myxococcus sp. AM011]